MRALPALLALAVLAPLPAFAAGEALLPDLQTVVPRHLQLVNEHQREVLRFSNGIANTGAGDWRMRPEFPLGDPSQPQLGIQELLDDAGNVVREEVVSRFEFHPAHNHWHIGGVALFEVRHVAPDGGIGALASNDRGEAQSVKTTFCLIDWYKLEGNSRAKDRVYSDCNGSHQGIQPGWVDQYHQSTDGQQLDLTGLAAGEYYLVSEANHDRAFLESDAGNNGSWVRFALLRESQGNPKLEVVGSAPCDGALCGDKAPNR